MSRQNIISFLSGKRRHCRAGGGDYHALTLQFFTVYGAVRQVPVPQGLNPVCGNENTSFSYVTHRVLPLRITFSGTAPPQTGIPHIYAQIPVSSAFRPLLRAFRSTSLQVSSPGCCRLLPSGCSGYASYALPLCSIHGSPWTRSRQKGRNSPERLLRGAAGFLEKLPKISKPVACTSAECVLYCNQKEKKSLRRIKI